MSYNNKLNSINNLINNKIKEKKNKNTKVDEIEETDDIDEIELEKIENELSLKLNNSNNKNYPKNYGNLWNDEERKIILNYIKKNNFELNISIYDEEIITQIAKKIDRSEYGVKEEIKKMIFNDYINESLTYKQLSTKYNMPEHIIKIQIKLYLEKYGKKILYPIEIENKILKSQIENIKLKKELEELKKNKMC